MWCVFNSDGIVSIITQGVCVMCHVSVCMYVSFIIVMLCGRAFNIWLVGVYIYVSFICSLCVSLRRYRRPDNGEWGLGSMQCY